jgi:hypothetical protein
MKPSDDNQAGAEQDGAAKKTTEQPKVEEKLVLLIWSSVLVC